jgi:hypothetical protein
MNQNLAIIAFAAMLLPAGPSIACYADRDCAVGSRCIKVAEENYGECEGGLAPGNANDLRPVHLPNDTSLKDGNNCTVDTDCGPESSCAKENGFKEGVCKKRKNEQVPAIPAK